MLRNRHNQPSGLKVIVVFVTLFSSCRLAGKIWGEQREVLKIAPLAHCAPWRGLNIVRPNCAKDVGNLGNFDWLKP